LDKLAV
jgi:hypothetical protein